MSLGFLAPAVCVGFVALDLALRLVPLDSLAFRAWEAVTVRHSRLSPFGVNIHYHNDRAHGELASMANRPDLSEFHPETFTTDAFGFRNSPTESSAGPPGGILVGSSFSAGCGVNDEETLSVRLGQRLGRPVYNAAGLTPSLELIRSVARRLRVASGVVWYEYYEPNPLPVSEQTAQRWRTRLPDWTVLQLLNSWKTSRLKILAGRAYRLLENNAFLPRTTPSHLGVRLLENGHPMIFANPTDLPGPSAIGQAGAYWSWLADELHKDGLSLVVLLVPGKYTVYHSLLRDKPRLSPPGAEYLGEIERQLKQRKVAVVNLEPVLRKEAENGLGKGVYVYRSDDTHWNPHGIDITADRLAGDPTLTGAASSSKAGGG